ncbi:biotin--[acetyl-CoA-carboxylase] ligase [Archaeoglobus profundus]|uniref:Biotin/acetyl-CoA-carboxylase ligase n=1 Tax=Archaeoglobus profundus (strain DSM 5631 / JCM 9629 / NBRC 100127 / Av18) TaxID=572546 RepID=D2RFG7_ARCPA|nr:biotin--[acetyl-CoA-carboxylase] ligase [Archaeoglobus profundus]ADB58861.1 biotin/acetyl-CoA-carboxylase ligase [Archaeoglobus profundus DSM 5631]
MAYRPYIVGVQEVSSEVVERLKEGVSGEILAELLGVSRTAVWKFIRKLESLGYVIEKRKGMGYKIVRTPDLSPYEVAMICRDLRLIDEVYYYTVVDSTNQRAKEVAKPKTLFIAERQTEGRGRYGRRWMSECGGLYFSITLPRDLPIEDVPKLTLTTGVAVAKALRARLKWPNDVVYNGRKLCGILCELFGEIEDPMIVVGVGVNVNNPTPPNGVSLKDIHGREFNRLEVLKDVLISFERYYFKLLNGGWGEIRNEWKHMSETLGKDVVVRTAKGVYTGRALDLDGDGGLILDVGGKIVKVFSGDCFYA